MALDFIKSKGAVISNKISGYLNPFQQKTIEYKMDTGEDDCDTIRVTYGAYSPWNVPEFTLVAWSNNHVVLYDTWRRSQDGVPIPLMGGDLWDQNHVKMPYSDMSCISTKRRWHVIKNALGRDPIKNSEDLEAAIMQYNDSFKNDWFFLAFHKFFNEYLNEAQSEEFFKITLPKMIKLALKLDKIVSAPIPLLKQNMNASISMSQQQVASLLANAFFCTFPRRNTTGPGTEFANYPRINFTQLYERIDLENGMEKLMSLVHYFKRVTTKMPTGVVTFTRRAVDKNEYPRWNNSVVPVGSIPLYVDDQLSIEDAAGLIQVDFANKYLGGGVLGRGCVQEEIRFLICPELIASMLFTEKLEANEAVVIIGCERYSKYSGYGRNFKFNGDYVDDTPLDASGRRRCVVLAIDAIPYHSPTQQFHKGMVLRELNKAWIGFSFESDPRAQVCYPGVATGNWGCGAFRGSPQLKSLLQLMACAQARRPMAYLSFGDAKVKDEVVAVYNLLKHYEVTVAQLYSLIGKYCKRKPFLEDPSMDLHRYLQHQLTKRPGGDVSRSPSPQYENLLSNPSPDNEGYTSDYENFTEDEDATMTDPSNRDPWDIGDHRQPGGGYQPTTTNYGDTSSANQNPLQGNPSSAYNSRDFVSRVRGVANWTSMIVATEPLASSHYYTGKTGSNAMNNKLSAGVASSNHYPNHDQGINTQWRPSDQSKQTPASATIKNNWQQPKSEASSNTRSGKVHVSADDANIVQKLDTPPRSTRQFTPPSNNATASDTTRVVKRSLLGPDLTVTAHTSETNKPSQSGGTDGRKRDPSRGRRERSNVTDTRPPQKSSPSGSPGWWKDHNQCGEPTRRPPDVTEPTTAEPGCFACIFPKMYASLRPKYTGGGRGRRRRARSTPGTNRRGRRRGAKPY